eukprot:458017-Pyramimonas_sp.AAC.1
MAQDAQDWSHRPHYSSTSAQHGPKTAPGALRRTERPHYGRRWPRTMAQAHQGVQAAEGVQPLSYCPKQAHASSNEPHSKKT